MNLIISNLGKQITEASLTELFGAFGTVEATEIMLDGFTGQSRGFAYVSMPDDSEAKTAMDQLSGRTVDGNTVVVAEAKPRTIHRGSYPVGRRSSN